MYIRLLRARPRGRPARRAAPRPGPRWLRPSRPPCRHDVHLLRQRVRISTVPARARSTRCARAYRCRAARASRRKPATMATSLASAPSASSASGAPAPPSASSASVASVQKYAGGAAWPGARRSAAPWAWACAWACPFTPFPCSWSWPWPSPWSAAPWLAWRRTVACSCHRCRAIWYSETWRGVRTSRAAVPAPVSAPAPVRCGRAAAGAP